MKFSLTSSKAYRTRQLVLLFMLTVQCSVYCNRADALGKYTTLICKDLPSATELDPGVIQTVDAFMNVGRFERAITVLKKNQNLYRDREMFLALLICTYDTGDAKGLIETCHEWFAHSDSSDQCFKSIVYEFLGIGHVMQKDYKGAVDAFGKSIQIDSRERVVKSRTEVESEIAKQETPSAGDEKGEGVKRKTIRLDIRLKEILDLNLRMGADLPLVETTQDESFSHSSANTKSLVSRAEKLEDAGRFKEARDIYRKASKRDDFDAFMWNQYGLCSITVLENLPSKPKKNPYTLADVKTSKKAEAARKLIVNALANVEKEPTEKDVEQIKGPFEKAVSMNDSDWRLWNNLGLVRYWTRKLKPGWKEALEKALSFHETPMTQRYAIRNLYHSDSVMELLKKRYSE